MSTTQRVPMTPKGHADVKKELEHLISNEREAVIRDIAEARSHGDLKENAEYHAAKDKQGYIESRIRYLQGQLSHAQVISPNTVSMNNEKVIFGATISLQSDQSDAIITYQIVGEDEANLNEGKLSYLSPISRALIGKLKGDTVQVKTPNGKQVYEIVEITYDNK
jgi:transcription elongation factor GreA